MSRARDLSRLSNPTNFTADGTTGRVGLGSENPTAKLNVAGIVSATAFYGDGSNLEGVASAGLGTALSDSGPGSVIYYTDKILGIAGNITVDVPDVSNSNVAYTQYEEISVESGIDFIVADGDDFVPDILGLSTAGTTPLSGAGGRVRADNFTNKAGTGAPTFSTGINVSGAATVSGNLNVGGVLTYEDVTNIDSVGIITARSDVSIADKIIHTGDTNTAIRFPAADTFTVETNGSERLRVRSTGDVGIGTVLPGNALHVFKTGDGQTPVFFETSNATGKLRFYNDSNGWSLDSEGDLRFVSGRTGSGAPTRLTISAAGAATFTGTVSDSIGPLRRLGVNGQSGAYAFVVGDAGKIIRSSGSGSALTLNQNIFTAGDMISVFNVSSGNNTVVQGTGVTLYNTADAATGTRTIAAKGMCTIVCTASNEFAISGSQLT
jgi:hypothetical protein